MPMPNPELSIIIPSYNRAQRLKACLKALHSQTQSLDDFEVIVVVDGSTDETMAAIQADHTPYCLRAIWQENSGSAAARNRGIAEARGRYCLFLDDDILASANLVAEHIHIQRTADNIVALGQIILSLPDDADAYAQQFAQGWRQHYDELGHGTAPPSWEDCYSGNLSVPREKLLACGGFATDLQRGEDVELGYRLWKTGCDIVYLPSAVSHQDERKGFRDLSRDAEKSGRADVIFYRRDPGMLSQSLGSFCSASWRKLLLRRIFLALHFPPALLLALRYLILKPRSRRSWVGFVQELCYWRGVRSEANGTELWSRIQSGVPILLFHAIGGEGEPPDTFLMPGGRFATHLRWIRRLGYRVITLEEFLACRREHRFPPPRSVVITFDDGYEDNHTNALPVLRNHQMPATVFLVSRFVGQKNTWDREGPLADRRLMGWPQIREMKQFGIGFGAHSQTHAALTRLESENAIVEIATSREEIGQAVPCPVTAFAYPYGLHSIEVQRMVEEAGYSLGCTVDPGLNGLGTPSFSLCRTELQGRDSLIRLLLGLWLGDPEAIWRRKRT